MAYESSVCHIYFCKEKEIEEETEESMKKFIVLSVGCLNLSSDLKSKGISFHVFKDVFALEDIA